jgi:hypothetical protein
MIGQMNVNITLTTVATSLYSLLAAINVNAPRIVGKVEIQGDDLNTDSWIVGDSNLATNNYAFKGINGGDTWMDEVQGDTNRIATPPIYLRSVTGSQTVHCRVRCL